MFYRIKYNDMHKHHYLYSVCNTHSMKMNSSKPCSMVKAWLQQESKYKVLQCIDRLM